MFRFDSLVRFMFTVAILGPVEFCHGQNGTAEELFNSAETAYSAGKIDRAIELYSQALALDSTYYSAYVSRGICYYDKDEFVLAIADQQRAIALVPDRWLAYMNRGNAMSRAGRFEEALTDQRKAAALRGVMTDTLLYNMANSFLRLGSLDSAVLYYDRTLVQSPGLVHAKANRAFALSELGRYEEAAVTYRELSASEPTHSPYLSNLAYVELMSGQLDSAAIHIDKAIRIDPDNAWAYRNRGLLRLASNDVKGACEDYKLALQLGFIRKWGIAALSTLQQRCR